MVRSFALGWLRSTFRGSIGKGDFIGGLAGNALTVAAHIFPAWQPTVNDLLWQIPIYGLAGAMAVRLVVAPYEMWKEQKERADKAEGELKNARNPNAEYYDAFSERVEQFSTLEITHRRDVIGDALREGAQRRREQTQATLANPIPNIDMSQALAIITEKTGKIDERARSELHDLASAGQVKVWGRHFGKIGPNPLFPILTDEWTDLYPYWWSDGRPDVQDQSIAQKGSMLLYQDLEFCREQIEDYFERRGINGHL